MGLISRSPSLSPIGIAWWTVSHRRPQNRGRRPCRPCPDHQCTLRVLTRCVLAQCVGLRALACQSACSVRHRVNFRLVGIAEARLSLPGPSQLFNRLHNRVVHVEIAEAVVRWLRLGEDVRGYGLLLHYEVQVGFNTAPQMSIGRMYRLDGDT